MDQVSSNLPLYQPHSVYREVKIPLYDTIASCVKLPFSWVSAFFSYMNGSSRGQKELPPSAPGHALIGHGLELWWHHRWDLIDFLSAYQAAYGHKGLCSLRLGTKTYYIVSDPKFAAEILHKPTDFPRGRSLEIWQEFSPGGLSEGPHTQEMRRRAIEAIGEAHYQEFFPCMKNAANAWVKRVNRLIDEGTAIDFKRECQRVTLASIGECLFKHDPYDSTEENPFSLDPENDQLCDSFLDSFETTSSILANKFTSPIGSYKQLYNLLHPQEAEKFQNAIDNLQNILLPIYQKLLQNPHEIEPKSKFKTLMDAFGIDIFNPNYPYMLNESLAFLHASFGTSATALLWLLYVSAKYPQIQENLYEELQKNLGNTDFAKEDLDSVQYLKQIMEETLRMFAPFAFLLRDIKNPDKFKSFKVEKDGIFVISPRFIHFNEAAWPNAEQFLPKRFTNTDSNEDGKEKSKNNDYDMLTDKWQRSNASYMPFLGGQHVCAGRFFGKLQIATIAAIFFLQYSISIDPLAGPVKLKFRMTLQPENPIDLKATKRP